MESRVKSKMNTNDPNQMILNHCRIMQLLTKAEKHLHQIFRQRWLTYQNLDNQNINEWRDSEECGLKLAQLCATAVPAMKELLKSGIIDLWDITLTNLAIQAVSKEIRKSGGKTDRQEDVLIDGIREIRNKIAHGKTELSNDDFEALWKELTEILIQLGDKASDLKVLKKKLLEIGKVKVEVKKDSAETEFSKLKEKANKFFKVEKYKEAIKIYDKILQLPGLLPEKQALIFSNRSAGYLMLKDESSLKMAKRDAEWSIQLWPCWWRGYHRLGHAYMKLEEWYEAEKSLEKALALNSEAKEVQDDLSNVRTQVGIFSREEHLNPIYHPFTKNDIVEDYRKKFGISEKQFSKLEKMTLDVPIYGDLLRGHQHRDGIDAPQDYKKAATFYAKAAAKENPEAMYNLGKLHHFGHGVARDYNESMRWLLKAANSKPDINIDSYVSDAQHFIGLKYSEGTGVPKDYKKAAEWYEKAVQNGYPGSANNLGMLYQHGHGVEKDMKKAFGYFKLAAQWNSTQGMQNLARCYFNADGTGSIAPTEEDIAEGMRWLKMAAEKGDLIAAREFERREKLSVKDVLHESFLNLTYKAMMEKNNPLNYEQFGEAVKEAAAKGSITAQQHLNIWKYLNEAMEAFKKKDSTGLVAALSKAIHLDHQIVEIPDMFHSIIEERFKTHPDDLDTGTCRVKIYSRNSQMPIIVDKYLKIYPQDEYLIEMFIAGCIVFKKYNAAKEVVMIALQMHPNSLIMLYNYAIVLCLQDIPTEECIKALDAFLAIAPKDHRYVPACYYRKAHYFLSKKDIYQFVSTFEEGLAAEKLQLICYLPYNYPEKYLLEKAFLHYKPQLQNDKNVAGISEALRFSNEKFEQIQSNPRRKFLHCQQRKSFIQYEALCNKPNAFFICPTNLPNTPKPPSLVSLKKITLKDMDSTTDKVYNGFVFEATIIEWSFRSPSVTTVIEDENGDTERLTVYNWPLNGDPKAKFIDAMKAFRPGTMVSIINPYMRMANDGQSMIRVESPAYIRLDNDFAGKYCSCCSREAKIIPCSACKMAFYCSKDCQKLDWTEFNHKEICKHLKMYAKFM